MLMLKFMFPVLFLGLLISCSNPSKPETDRSYIAVQEGDVIKVYLQGQDQPVVTQHAAPDHRPYLHPILAPGSEVALTQYSPGHHRHQTGLYWGFTRVNGSGALADTLKKWFYRKDKPESIRNQIGRDFFHHPEGSHWQRVSARVLIESGDQIKWQTVYHMLDEAGEPLMQETQIWTFSAQEPHHLLELEWKGLAIADITINTFDYGGLFLRMPWQEGIDGAVINAARQRNDKADGQRAMWVDVGMAVAGLDKWGHIAIFDHPDNEGFPQHWRVDGQMGVGPVPAKTTELQIHKGETKTFRHQIVAYSGPFEDITLNDYWADYVGDHGMYNTAALWGIAQQEALEAKFLSPEEAVDAMTIAEGYTVNTYASEPMITQPMAFCWDSQGRMWIAENRDYESRGHGFSNSGDSRILILEDTDQDGVADTSKVFLEGIPFPSAIAVGFDGLFLGAPPNLLFVPDRDGDDRADLTDIEVLLTGWGIRDRHETINSLHWGPDGWLYGLEGFATPSKIRKPQDKGRIYRYKEPFPEDLLDAEGVDINGGVWRYHPIKDRFEVVAHGFSNPWGIDYDAKGQLFISACVIPHLFHVIPGGIYHRQGGKHFNPYVYKDIRTIVDHRHRSAHGGARIYQSDAFPLNQRGRLFMANIHEHAVLSDILKPDGSGFTASHGEDFLLANNAQWVGFSMEVGPEGGLYVLDWHDADICGKEVLQKETGRVFRIMPDESLAEAWPGRYEDLNQLSDLQLVELQWQPSDWHARRARVLLQKRANQRGLEAEAIDRLQEQLAGDNQVDLRLKALWSLHITNNISPVQLNVLLDDPDPHIRGWAIQFLGEDLDVSHEQLQHMADIAKTEPSPVTRLYLAAILQRLDHADRWNLASALVNHAADADDPNIPYMLWFGIEPLVANHPEKVLTLAASSQIPMITQHIARRLVDGNALEIIVDALANPALQAPDFLQGMLAGLEGKTDINEPGNWSAVYPTLRRNKTLAETALQIAQHFGNATAAREMLTMIGDNKADPAQRRQAISSLALQKHPDLAEPLRELLHEPGLRMEAIRAIASYQDQRLGEGILAIYPELDLQEKQEAVQTLSSRPVYGRLLANAIKEGQMSKKEIPPYIALQLRRVVGNGFVEIWGPIDEVESDKQAEYAKYQRLLNEGAIAGANPQAGKMVFLKTCAACHKLFGEGGNMGPDLTGSNRTNTAYLLSNIIEPSGEIQDDYKMVVITTQDGRTYTGNITSEDDRQITMRIVGQDDVQISKSQIQSQETSPNSMMPEGLLQYLTDSEILDLVAYLKSEAPVEELEVMRD